VEEMGVVCEKEEVFCYQPAYRESHKLLGEAVSSWKKSIYG
jgi:hypothetical protein